MRRTFAPFFCTAILLISACSQQETPPVATTPAVDHEALRREKLFGAEAKDPTIAWRPSGLGIRIISPGEGANPKTSDTVRVHYIGRLKDGVVFDDSHKRGQPLDFVVREVIAGWAAAMPSLKPGGRAVFFIPPALGYGSLKTGLIPANSGLIFEIELIAVNP